MAQWLTNLTRNHEVSGLIPGLAQWVKESGIACVGLIYQIYATYKLAQKFGKGVGFTLGLLFVPFVFFPMLGFDDSEYDGYDDTY